MFKRLLFVAAVVASINAANILFVAPTHNIGTYLYLEAFVKELLALKHSVTLLTCYTSRNQLANLTTIAVPILDIDKKYPSKDILLGSYLSETKQISRDWKISLLNSEHFLKNEKVQAFIKNKDQKFDLVIIEQNYESMFSFAVRFACPLVTISSSGYTSSMDLAMGHQTPLSHVSHHSLPYNKPMTFFQRVNNVFVAVSEAFFRRFSYISSQNSLAQKYFKDSIDKELPHVATIEKQVSVMLVNYHRSLNLPRPRMPGQVDIAGAHIRPVLKLADDINPFFQGAEHGIILFSLGTDLRSEDIPKEKLVEIIEAFRGIKQRVLWKFDGEAPENLPENVKILKWFPQSSALGHAKVVLFITHGGILSVEESLARAVPMLFIPFVSQQQRAAQQAEQGGYGLTLQFDELTRETFADAINSILTSLEFKRNAIEASKLFTDNPIPPMKEATFWIEHAIGTNGARYMKSSAIHLDHSTHLLFDVGSFFFTIFALSILALVLLIKFIVRRYRNKEQKGKFKYY